MACRRALDITNLKGCFSNAASIKIFEDKRREAVVRADEAFNIHTMTHAMPILRDYRRMLELCGHGIEIVRQLEETMGELETLLADAMREGTKGKELQRIRSELKSAAFEAKRQFCELVQKPHRAALRFLWRLTSDSTARLEQAPVAPAVAGPAAAAPVAAPVEEEPTRVDRLLKCAVSECTGLFHVAKGTCLVCEATHCTACHERYVKTHTCQPGARATARVVLAQTKGCPRCHTPIMRASGCPQMMCTNCHCIFSWTTGEEERGTVHNPHYFQLSADARAKVVEDRAARGLAAPAANAPAVPMVCPDGQVLEFDPMCIGFDDPRIFAALTESYARVFPFNDAGRLYTWNEMVDEYQRTSHVGAWEIRNVDDSLRAMSSEQAMRMQRLARMGGSIAGIKRPQKRHGRAADDGTVATVVAAAAAAEAEDEMLPEGPVPARLSERFVIGERFKRLSDARYAAVLMRNDTMRSRLMSKREILVTYEETQKDQFRAALLVPPSERREAALRIFNYRAETGKQLRDAAMFDRKHALKV
jgi:hypothetical protein